MIVIILAGADHPESSEEADEEAPHDNFRLTAHSGAGGSCCHTFRHISNILSLCQNYQKDEREIILGSVGAT